MKFVQIIDFETERLDEMEQLVQEVRQGMATKEGGPTHRILLKDRDTPGRYLALIEFDSYEEAMRNSEDPDTSKMAERMGALCTREPRYVNCDLLDSSDL
ncbi:hypothetical protein Stsp02_36580 [Streptomyces sp. NBRC 14336]|uniref:hypothetical protein n=1 Tax=Streptomyces sp. NBRC 14336 TaxID=3030992 RepID=UPI0024A2A491|nr:hypothetical protein [Streptomyces sp. NBRC 14336]WBO77303.1 hypothetical protein SBE_000816 [Streptomyces sp. SBE_14.2]GLW47996.1 hypothetical protein Stsp02_36580 [Streptomyces sp. NBRC 14336]